MSDSKKVLIESCVESLDEAIYAVNKGADRIELCSNLEFDGLTPDFSLVTQVLEAVNIPVKVMIRPRSGDFCYNFEESKLITLAKSKSFTIHKAIDSSIDPLADITLLKSIISDQFNHETKLSILSSGQAKTALEGAEMLNLMRDACAEKISLIVCGKVTHTNLQKVIDKIPNDEYHGRRIV